MMKTAFALYKYFPYGGLQSDMLRMARTLSGAGHQVFIYTTAWEGERPADPNLKVCLLKAGGLTNHGKLRSFETAFLKAVNDEAFDCKVVFVRMRGGDYFFAADNCLGAELPLKHSRLALRLNPRYAAFLEQERKVFAPGSRTRILYISPRQKAEYMACYGTQENRFIELPPGISPAFKCPDNLASLRRAKRRELGLKEDDILLILTAANLLLKGADRVVEALSGLAPAQRNKTVLLLAGGSGEKKCAALAERLNMTAHVRFVGVRNDLPELFPAVDLMVHPARNEAAGNVLVEALASGLPVLCSGVCGYADYVRESGGIVLPEPFSPSELCAQLGLALNRLDSMRAEAERYAAAHDFTARGRVFLRILENLL